MFAVSESDAALIRAAFNQGGELSAAVELRRLSPGITDGCQPALRQGHRRLAAVAAPAR